MANTRLYLDERGAKKDRPCVLKIVVAHKGVSALISLNAKILPNQWDNLRMKVVSHPDAMLMNVYIQGVKRQVDTIILSLANDGQLHSMSAKELRNYIQDQLNPEKAEEKKEAKRRANLFAHSSELPARHSALRRSLHRKAGTVAATEARQELPSMRGHLSSRDLQSSQVRPSMRGFLSLCDLRPGQACPSRRGLLMFRAP